MDVLHRLEKAIVILDYRMGGILSNNTYPTRFIKKHTGLLLYAIYNPANALMKCFIWMLMA